MEIEFARREKMTQTGSSLLRILQNNHIPIADLLIRESIQNSLDACKKNQNNVIVSLKVGCFRPKELNSEFEGITAQLNKLSGTNGVGNYLLIKDTNTQGLTGDLNYDNVNETGYGNYLKLVCDICKPQTNEGAGGSWGMGKTVYYRVGIGLVIYYSRIFSKEKMDYEERLAACLVEDENAPASKQLLKYGSHPKMGMAWWGKTVSENRTEAITDTEYIYKFLKKLNISPYEGDKTGTAIIIPYIDREKLLSECRRDYSDIFNNSVNMPWQNDLSEYLRMAVQKWYSPRLNNPEYSKKNNLPFLSVYVDDEPLSLDQEEPFFDIIRKMYNYKSSSGKKAEEINGRRVEFFIEDIEGIQSLSASSAGTLIYSKIPKDALKMCVPYNKPSPFCYLGEEIEASESNKPVICFTRKPGMIVSYNSDGKWVTGINSTKKDEFIIGLFVLNSSSMQKVKFSDLQLEEYVRKTELADHMSWTDPANVDTKNKVIAKVQNKVRTCIKNQFNEEDISDSFEKVSGLASIFGKMLLPPESFGHKPSVAKSTGRSGSGITLGKTARVSLKMDPSKTIYTSEGMEVSLQISAKKYIHKTGIELSVGTEQKTIPIEEWEAKLGMELPFDINDIEVVLTKVDEQKREIPLIFGENKTEEESIDYSLKYLKSGKGKNYGFFLSFPKEQKVDLSVKFTISLSKREIKTVYNLIKD